MTDATNYRVRFRFHMLTPLTLDVAEHHIEIAGRSIVLKAMIPSRRIRDSEWLVVDARGFATEDEARAFATKLKAAASVASIGTRLGINTGLDLATSGVGRAVADRAREEFGVVLGAVT